MSVEENKKWTYSSAVKQFDDIICNFWDTQTSAPTRAKALANLKFRYKREHGLVPSAQLSLPGKLVCVDNP